MHMNIHKYGMWANSRESLIMLSAAMSFTVDRALKDKCQDSDQVKEKPKSVKSPFLVMKGNDKEKLMGKINLTTHPYWV